MFRLPQERLIQFLFFRLLSSISITTNGSAYVSGIRFVSAVTLMQAGLKH